MIFSKIVWNPSIGIDLGFFTIHYYSLMFVIAFSLGYYLMKKIYINEGQKMEHLESVFMYAVIATLLGARMGHVIFYQPELFKEDFFSVFLPAQFRPEFKFTGFQGLASHGAAIAFIIAMYLYSKKVIKKPTLWTLDRVTIPAAFGGIFVRIGNFINSEIIGEKTDFVTGVRFIKESIPEYQAIKLTGIKKASKAYDAIVNKPKFQSILEQVDYRHPAQLYEAFGYIFVSFILLYLYWKTDKKDQPGFLFGTYMLLIFFVRFLVEYVKKSQGGFENVLGLMSTGQWLSIPFMGIGIYFLWNASKKNT
ncbi:prolipoprotein diacylglyceryl transferase [Aquimarina agarilytica]|uniref:prolipoprotein diacylglyceryl transferase n=1 Tax=Aquimarina agarilytica TaxID=1087449 RepID=UPI000289F7C3|nr:prolipoprotein diacylglyceryl transferase [Aquimarina agarilytica]